jgi:ParB family chromosome partitioning protein
MENLQRRNLNPIEEAQAFARLRDMSNMTQEEIARRLGITRDHVAQRLRLLSLPEWIQENVSRDTVGPSVAEALAYASPQAQNKLMKRIEEGWRPTVKEVQEFAKKEDEKRKTQSNSPTTTRTESPDVTMRSSHFIVMPPEYSRSEPLNTAMDPPVKLTLDVWLLHKQMKIRPDETIVEFVRRIILDYFKERSDGRGTDRDIEIECAIHECRLCLRMPNTMQIAYCILE